MMGTGSIPMMSCHDYDPWSLVTWLGSANGLSQFSKCSFQWQDVILEGYFENSAVIIWLDHQYLSCRGTFQDYSRLWIKAFGLVVMKLPSFEVACPVISCMHESEQICGFLLCLGRWKDCSLGFSRHRKGCSHYSVRNTKRLAILI